MRSVATTCKLFLNCGIISALVEALGRNTTSMIVLLSPSILLQL